MRFYLGTHMPSWLPKTDVPLFVSYRRLIGRKRFKRALGPWALDSGGFTELSMFGKWTVSAEQYAEAVHTYQQHIGNLDWAAPMDWMCEPWIIEKTGLSVREHQERTVVNFLDLRATGLPFIPVLQGWALADYIECIGLYEDAGVDLRDEPIVGIGSVCRRQATSEIGEIASTVAADGIRLHGFGVKRLGIRKYGKYLASADSLAWSFRGRRVEGCAPDHRNEANCLRFAMEWREETISGIE